MNLNNEILQLSEDNMPDHWINDHFVREVCMFIKNGFRLPGRKIIIPIQAAICSAILCFTCSLLVSYLNINDKVIVFEGVHYALHMIVLTSCAFVVLKNRDNIMEELNEKLDNWFHYKAMGNECEEVRKRAQAHCLRMLKPYVISQYSNNLLFSFAPLIKLLISADRSRMLDFLIFPCYFPWSLDTWYGFTLAYMLQIVASYFGFVTYTRVACYLATTSIHIAHQMELAGIALKTVGERSRRITIAKGYYPNSSEWESCYKSTLQEEIRVCAKHLQFVLRLAKIVSRCFIPNVTTTYVVGVWIICLSGVLLSTMQEEKALILKVSMMFVAELTSVYVLSASSEYLMDSVKLTKEALYNSDWYTFPVPCRKDLITVMFMLIKEQSLGTIIGSRANMENMSNILNAAYTYFSMIIATSKKNSNL